MSIEPRFTAEALDAACALVTATSMTADGDPAPEMDVLADILDGILDGAVPRLRIQVSAEAAELMERNLQHLADQLHALALFAAGGIRMAAAAHKGRIFFAERCGATVSPTCRALSTEAGLRAEVFATLRATPGID